MTPDPEAVAVQALRAALGGSTSAAGRISTRLSGTFPAVRVTLVGGVADVVDDTSRPSVQWEAWGNGTDSKAEGEAADLARLIQSVAGRLAGSYQAGRVVGSRPTQHYFHSPDPQTSRERYIGQIELLCQP